MIETLNEDDDQSYYSINYSQIKSLVENNLKNNIISVILVDYSMPLMNGIEFCEKIAHLPVQKIMLTGNADFKIAIDAFNRKIIDQFLVKDCPNMLQNIIDNIHLMQQQFFEKQSYPLWNCFISNKNLVVNSFEYITHFKDIVKKLNAIEYYLLDVFGSYLFISNHNKRFYFIVFVFEQLDELIDLTKNTSIEKSVFQKLINKTHAPIFIEQTDYQLPFSDWNNILYPIEKMTGYYYCLISEQSMGHKNKKIYA